MVVNKLKISNVKINQEATIFISASVMWLQVSEDHIAVLSSIESAKYNHTT